MEKELQRFKKIFELKSLITPIAEKADRNLKTKKESIANSDYRIYHFAIGHTFKKNEKELLFDIERNNENGELIINRYKELYYNNHLKNNYFDKINESLTKLVSITRNIYAHYVHDFSKTKTSDYQELIPFLESAFEVSCIFSFIKEKEISLAKYFDEYNDDKEFVNFLTNKFYPLNDKRKDDELSEEQLKRKNEYLKIRKEFITKSKKDAIHSLLYIEVEQSFEWKINNSHTIFEIEKGTYFSDHAHLFVLSMFLYRNEAEKLISKITGFKRNDDNSKKSKRNIFTFFSKKFSSQDIDSEENNLVKFRDIMQYLNKYPVAWNREIEKKKDSLCKNMIEPLNHKMLDLEILKAFPKIKDGRNANRNDENFIIYMKYELKLGYKKQVQQFTNEEREDYNYEINTNKRIQDADWKIKEYKTNIKKEFDQKKIKDLEKAIEKHQDVIKEVQDKGLENTNTKYEKLKKRVLEDSLLKSCGRNQDRFMDFACRFLAETHYFGKETKFKCYKFYDESQNEYLKDLSKEERDQQKYHHGKVIDFYTLEQIQAVFPQDYSPFIIENNAIQLILEKGKYISIQRNLMIYFLEHALFSSEPKLNLGLDLLQSYFEKQQVNFIQNLESLKSKTEISKIEKTEYLKYFPKRLLHQYYEADYSKNEANKPIENPYQHILENAKNASKRYENLLKEAEQKQKDLKDKKIDNTLFEDFKKKNKGKQYKLRFIKRVWNIMYFKDAYNTTKEAIGHHTSNHISKDEYNDFCKYIFAFGEVSDYKILLTEMLESKGFFTDGLKNIFDKSKDIGDLFTHTLSVFEKWIKEKSKEKRTYKIENYNYLKQPEKSITYINASLFIEYLKNKNILMVENNRLQYQSLANSQYLIPEFYYKEKIEIQEAKKNNDIKSLYNKLRTNRLEDCLLYEMALYYLNTEQGIKQNVKKTVIEILSSDLEFDVNDKDGNFKYKFILPFNKLEAFIEQTKFKETQEKRFGKGYLENIGNHYLENNKNDKALKNIYGEFSKNQTLTYDGFNKINAQVMASSCKFSAVYMALEAYCIDKDNLKIVKNNRIDFDEIPSIKDYVRKEERDKVSHFGLQKENYQTILKRIETKFLKEEIKKPIKEYADLSSSQKNVLFGFMKYYDDRNKYVYDENKLLKDEKRRAREEEEANTPISPDEVDKNKWWKTFNEKWRKIKQDRAEKYYVQYINTIK